MKKTLAALAVSLLAISAAHASDDPVVRKEIEGRYAIQTEALKKKDVDAYVSIVTEDFEHIRGYGKPLDLPNYKRVTTAKVTKGVEEDIPEIKRLDVSGDRAIVVSSRSYKFYHRDSSTQRPEKRLYTAFYNELWVHGADGWKLKIRKEVTDASAPPADFGK